MEDGEELFAVCFNNRKLVNESPDEILFEEGGVDEDFVLGLDHVDRTKAIRNGQEMFLK